MRTFFSLKNTGGYVLPFVLFITVLVITVLLGLITLLFFLNNTEQKKVLKKKLDLACYSAVQKVLSEDEFIPGSEILEVDKYQVLIEKDYQGLYYKITASAKDNYDSSKAEYLFAYNNFFPDNIALAISRQGLRATVAGKTKIEGDILASTERITKGNIFGIESSPDNYLDGKIVTDVSIDAKIFGDSVLSRILPVNGPGPEYFTVDNNFILDNTSLMDSISGGAFYIAGDLIIRGNIISAPGKLIKFYVSGKTTIETGTISDLNMEIKCDSVIEVGNNVKLANILLSSDKGVTIGESSSFKNIQIFSQENIYINSSRFNYPSVVCMFVDVSDTSAINNRLEIKSSVINGSVLLISSTTGLAQNKSLIDIDEKSRIHGFVYSENNIRMPGKIEGFAYTYGFWYYKQPTEYINWLVDVKINRHNLSKWYLLPVGFFENSRLEILKEIWIY